MTSTRATCSIDAQTLSGIISTHLTDLKATRKLALASKNLVALGKMLPKIAKKAKRLNPSVVQQALAISGMKPAKRSIYSATFLACWGYLSNKHRWAKTGERFTDTEKKVATIWRRLQSEKSHKKLTKSAQEEVEEDDEEEHGEKDNDGEEHGEKDNEEHGEKNNEEDMVQHEDQMVQPDTVAIDAAEPEAQINDHEVLWADIEDRQVLIKDAAGCTLTVPLRAMDCVYKYFWKGKYLSTNIMAPGSSGSMTPAAAPLVDPGYHTCGLSNIGTATGGECARRVSRPGLLSSASSAPATTADAMHPCQVA